MKRRFREDLDASRVSGFISFARLRQHALHSTPPSRRRVRGPRRPRAPGKELLTMAAIGSALHASTLRGASAQLKGKKTTRAVKARSRDGSIRAASSEPKIQDVVVAIDPKSLLPQGLYCESNYQTFRRPTRYGLLGGSRKPSPSTRARPRHHERSRHLAHAEI